MEDQGPQFSDVFLGVAALLDSKLFRCFLLVMSAYFTWYIYADAPGKAAGVDFIQSATATSYEHGGADAVEEFCKTSSPIRTNGYVYNCTVGYLISGGERVITISVTGFHGYKDALAAHNGDHFAAAWQMLISEKEIAHETIS